jgi:hypothetical protein
MFALKDKLMTGPRLVHDDPYAARRELVATIAAARADILSRLPALVAAEKQATERLIAAENELRLAQLEVAQAQAERGAAAFAGEREIAKAEAKLRQCAPVEMIELKAEFRATERRLMARAPIETDSKNQEQLAAAVAVNRAVTRHLANVRRAIRTADEWASTQALDDLPDVLAKLRAMAEPAKDIS